MEKVVIIGSGNLAYSLSLAIAGCRDAFTLTQVCSRNRIKGREIADKCKIDYVSTLSDVKKADIYIVAVKDSAVSSVIGELSSVVNNDSIIAHTSAVCSVNSGEKFARFYPLQTFTYGIEADFKKITIFIEANCEKREQKLITLSNLIAKGSERVDSKRLKVLHLAATFANNFTNRMYHYAEQILASENINRDVLYPLIDEGVAKIERSDLAISMLQTGAAVRGDKETINLHRELIETMNNEEMLEIYNAVTKTICNDKF